MKVNYGLIGKRIKEHRQRRNLTQEMLAELIEVSPGYISLVETGRKKASLETLLSISNVLNITLNELLVGNQIPLTFHASKAHLATRTPARRPRSLL